MTNTRRTLGITAALATLGILTLLTAGQASPPDTREVEFGKEHVGSPFPPQVGHDRSTNAVDDIVPRTATISAGGSITYHVYPFHQVAIYGPGTTTEDIEVSPATLEDVAVPCVPFPLDDFRINDPDNRIALSPAQSCDKFDWETPPGTFDTPGRYLVICTTTPHFFGGMWGWVIVK